MVVLCGGTSWRGLVEIVTAEVIEKAGIGENVEGAAAVGAARIVMVAMNGEEGQLNIVMR
jgi:hypothetical protein